MVLLRIRTTMQWHTAKARGAKESATAFLQSEASARKEIGEEGTFP